MNWPVLIACMAISFLPGLIGSVLMKDIPKQPWYLDNKPKMTPPPLVFPIVWNILYAMLGVVLYIVYMSNGPERNFILVLCAINLVLNALWSILFFVERRFAAAYVNILMMVLVSTLVIYHSVSRSVKWLMTPYLAWLMFASTLNLHFVLLKWNGVL